jgi:signal transduction histidine kinase
MVAVTIRRLGLGVTVALLLALGILDLVQHYHVRPGVAMVLTAVRVVPLLFYRRRPVEAWIVELSAVVLTALITVPVSVAEPWPWAVTSTATLTAVGALVAAVGAMRLTMVMFGIMTGLTLLLGLSSNQGNVATTALTPLICAVAMIAGGFVHGRRQIVAELVEERQISAAERELRSVVEERARIARELHDVVAHHMSMITVQAETARFRHVGLPEAAVAEFTEIASVARRSLSELRGLLSALRDDGADPHRTPQPTLADLPSLAERITAAGTPVRLTVAPAATDLSQVMQLAVYRIVQESLSNVVRHAPGAQARVDIVRTEETLRVEVTNERPQNHHSHRRPVPTAEGHGLVGLRERVTLLGGTFEVDQPDEGWRVWAMLPLRPDQPHT